MEGNKSTAVMNAEKKKRTPLLKHQGLQTLISSLFCIVLGLIVGYLALLIINPEGAGTAIKVIMQNFLKYSETSKKITNLGNTLVKTAPLIMCSLSVLFAYKVGLFNIGAAGQYVAGAGLSLYCALALGMPWYVCLVAALVAGALLGTISGAMKAWLNVNEVISCIMLNWITLYSVNMLLVTVKHPTKAETLEILETNEAALLPRLGLDKLFAGNTHVTIAIPLAIIAAVLIWVLLSKTKLGYELRATGSNKHAAKYAGMREKTNMVLTMAIAGGLAGLGAGMYYLTGFEQWNPSMSSVPPMGFNGIAAAFLGGLNPIGAVFSSYFIEHISGGGAIIDKSMYFSEISDLISAVIIYLCGFVLLFRGFITKLSDRVEEAGGWCVALFSRKNLYKTISIAACVLVIAGLAIGATVQNADLAPLTAQSKELQDSIDRNINAVNLQKQNTEKAYAAAAAADEAKAETDAKIAAVNDEITAATEAAALLTDARAAQAAQLEEIAATILAGEGDVEALAADVAQMIDALNAAAPADGEEAKAE